VEGKKEGIERSEKVRKREEFIRLFKNGSRFYSPQYDLIVAENQLGLTRVAVVVSRKIGNAVVRNYEKRLCREVFRKEKGKLKTGYDIVIIVKYPTHNFKDSSEQLKELFLKALGPVFTGECRI